MSASRRERLRTLEGQLTGALAYALAAGDRRWYRTLARRHARVTRALARRTPRRRATWRRRRGLSSTKIR